ncbi:uncharacterized protein [Clytia hemisphaerica]|uniref:Uncharacterized protein n=1 Tax=Clytia hemisphaerica TaxID=252671 RepID=A0A7M5WVJ4_9CNID
MIWIRKVDSLLYWFKNHFPIILFMTALLQVVKASNVYQLIAKDKTLASERPFTRRLSKFGIQCISMCDHSPVCLSYAFNGQTCYLYDVMFKTTNGEHRALKDQTGTVYHSTVADSCETWHQLGKRRNGFYYVGSEVNGQQRKAEIYCYLNQEVFTTVPPTITTIASQNNMENMLTTTPPTTTLAPTTLVPTTLVLTTLAPTTPSLIIFRMKISITFYCNNINFIRWACYPYGVVRCNVGNRQENQDIEIWNVQKANRISIGGKREVFIKEKYHQFQEYLEFTESSDKVTFTGHIKDYHPIASDKTIAEITGNSFQANDIYNTLKTEQFLNSRSYVKISVIFERA